MTERWEELEARWETLRGSGDEASLDELRAVVAAHVEAYERLERLVAERLEAAPPLKMVGGGPVGIAAQVYEEARTGLARYRDLLARIDAARG